MKHCPEPSLKERAAKWARRNPTLCSSTSIATAGVLLIAVLSIAGLLAYDGMLGLRSRLRLQALSKDFSQAQFLLNTAGRREETLKRGLLQANALLHREGIPDPVVGIAAGPTAPVIEPDWIGRLTREEKLAVRRDLIELLMLEARGTVALAAARGAPDDVGRATRRALVRLDQAGRLDAPMPAALYRDRASYHEQLGEQAEAARNRAKASTLPPRSSRDWALLGTVLLEGRDLLGAEQALRNAIAQDLASPWAWFLMGHCHYEQGRYADAVGDFSASVACGPSHAWTHFNRGLALARVGRLVDARLAYDRAIELDPLLIEARVNRGIVEIQLDRPREALVDLQQAVAAGCREVGAIAALADLLARQGEGGKADLLFAELLSREPGDAVALVARGMSRLRDDPVAAQRDFESVLSREPWNAMAHYGMARLIRSADRKRALSHLDLALQADPDLTNALQLRALERARSGDRGALDDVDRLVRIPAPDHLYNAACALAILGRRANDTATLGRAVDLLAQSLRSGFPADRAAADPDLGSLHDRDDYARVLSHFTSQQARKSPDAGSRRPD
jgi:tetratricopeptide (TPR) repeat protein